MNLPDVFEPSPFLVISRCYGLRQAGHADPWATIDSWRAFVGHGVYRQRGRAVCLCDDDVGYTYGMQQRYLSFHHHRHLSEL